MHDHFSQTIERRGTGSLKWDLPEMSGVLPMWVADMDFRAPECVINALHQEVDFGVFGYALPSPNVVESIIDWCKKRYQWDIKEEWLVFVPGLETALALCADSVGQPGDQVICLDPIYPPFYAGPRRMERKAVRIPLLKTSYGWEVNWIELEKALSMSSCSLLLFCHPHNPTGKVFQQEELLRILQLCKDHDVAIVSDEVHCDLILDDRPHTPMATLNTQIGANIMTLMAPNKTFNIAGLGGGYAICEDPKWRQSLGITMKGISPHPGAMAHVACKAAYTEGEPWRQELLAALRSNLSLLKKFISSHGERLSMVPPEATYLAWIDATAMGLNDPSKHFKAHGLGLSPGKIFGDPQYLRLNFACPEVTMKEGLSRMERALKALDD